MSITKIATCSFCGTRAALVLRGEDRHELSCASCGAPLHDLKMLPKRSDDPSDGWHHKARPGVSSHQRAMSRKDVGKGKKRKKSKSFAQRAFGEIWDVIEDILD